MNVVDEERINTNYGSYVHTNIVCTVVSLNDAKNAGIFFLFILFFNELESGNENRVKMHVIVSTIFIAVTHRGNGNGYRYIYCTYVQTATSMYYVPTRTKLRKRTYVLTYEYVPTCM